jgi:hypothetical protein
MINSEERLALVVVVILSTVPGARAQLPGTDIWVGDLTMDGRSVHIDAPVNATRRPGYDNQPAFLPDGSFLYSAGDIDGRTDVFKWDAETGIASRVTQTPESEYSPTPFVAKTPGFCAVRVEAGGVQRLWRFEADGSDARPVMSDVDSVGYFTWIDARAVAVFVVGDPHTLRRVDVATQTESIVAKDIGRYLQCVPATRDVAFTIRGADDRYAFYRLPGADTTPVPLIGPVGEGQDAAWARDTLLATTPTGVYAARPFESGVWVRVADTSAWGLTGVTRIAVAPDARTVAIVAAE